MPSSDQGRAVRRWAVVGIAGELLFTASWLVADRIARPGYRPLRDDLSELSARTAPHAWLYLGPELVAGLASVGFAVFALRPALAGAGHLGATAAWLSAAASLQDLTDPFFRLPCRAADGCSTAQQTVGTAGEVHALLGLLGLALSVASGLALWRAFARLPGWRALSLPALVLSVLVVVAVFAIGAQRTAASHGLLQRLLVLVAGAYGVWTAQRAYALHHAHRPRLGGGAQAEHR